jgi:hypothetical protein
MCEKKNKWIFDINNNKVIVENKKKFSRFVALKVLTNNRIIKNERNRN